MGLFGSGKGLTVRVKMNKFQLLKLSQAQLRAFEMTAEALKTEINTAEVEPKQTSALSESKRIETSKLNKGQMKIIYDVPYARRQYYHPEFNFRTDKNRNAKGLWLDDLLTGDKKDFVQETYAKFLHNCGKGVIK